MANKGKGRPDKYIQMGIEDRLPEIEGLARDGYRNEDIAKALGVSVATLHNWRIKYPEFAEAILKGKEVVDAEVENELLTNAMGRVYWEETQELAMVRDEETDRMVQKMITVKRVKKYVKPDTTAQIFWLKNRKPDQWRDKNYTELSGGLDVSGFEYMSDEELQKELEKLKRND
jgi:transposase-like protein